MDTRKLSEAEERRREREEKIKMLKRQMQGLAEDDPLRAAFEEDLKELQKNP